MYVPFNQLPNSSKIWIYQSNKEFNKNEIVEINTNLKSFVQNWTSHSDSLHASFDIKHNYFIIIGVDTTHNDTSGCSQDALFRNIKELEKSYDLSLLDRENLAFLIDDKVKIIKLKDIEKNINNNNINIQSIFFNNLAHFLEDLNNNWLVPIEKTWLNKYF